MSNDDI